MCVFLLLLFFAINKAVVAGIEDLSREAGVSLRESKVRTQFETLVEASDALKKAVASGPTKALAGAAGAVGVPGGTKGDETQARVFGGGNPTCMV